MAEHKYELWTIPPRVASPKHYPWYAERLRQKYLPSKPSGSLLSNNWIFVKEGGDDYRTGIPRESLSAKASLTRKDGSRPHALLPRSLPPLDKRAITARVHNKLDKNAIAFSKKVPRQEFQMHNINVVEKSLTDHPLAVYPHYEEAVEPGLFEEIVETLDPDLRNHSESDLSSHEEEEAVSSSSVEEKKGEAAEEEDDQKLSSSSFRWYPKQEPFDESKSSPAERSSGHTKIQGVTNEFCEWVRLLGGDSNNIEESTIFSLFASGYETKPALSVPIHVVQLSDVPFELRNGAMVSPDLPSLLQYGVKNLTIKRGDTPKVEPSALNHWIRHQYGAWYLPVDLWKHKNTESGLTDPKEDTMKTVSEAKLKSRELDSTLATMHGAMSFREYLDRKNLRRPEFLHEVDPLLKEEPVTNSAKSVRGGSSDMV